MANWLQNCIQTIVMFVAPIQNMINPQQGNRNASGTPDIKLNRKDSIKIDARNCRLEDVIAKLFPLLNIPYNILSNLDDVVSLKYENITFDALVQELFAGTFA